MIWFHHSDSSYIIAGRCYIGSMCPTRAIGVAPQRTALTQIRDANRLREQVAEASDLFNQWSKERVLRIACMRVQPFENRTINYYLVDTVYYYRISNSRAYFRIDLLGIASHRVKIV